ncbi:MAG: Asp-tRNA(Asn)/Glu-tRNA(Gln) amidotransferase subunit GatC [Candidatus Omnitrophota bacterium]
MIDNKIVEGIANLARIELTEDELVKFSKEFKHILSFIDRLKEVNIDNTPPTIQAILMDNLLRDDLVEDSLPIEKALANAPLKKGNFFLVPKIIE